DAERRLPGKAHGWETSNPVESRGCRRARVRPVPRWDTCLRGEVGELLEQIVVHGSPTHDPHHAAHARPSGRVYMSLASAQIIPLPASRATSNDGLRLVACAPAAAASAVVPL